MVKGRSAGDVPIEPGSELFAGVAAPEPDVGQCAEQREARVATASQAGNGENEKGATNGRQTALQLLEQKWPQKTGTQAKGIAAATATNHQNNNNETNKDNKINDTSRRAKAETVREKEQWLAIRSVAKQHTDAVTIEAARPKPKDS